MTSRNRRTGTPARQNTIERDGQEWPSYGRRDLLRTGTLGIGSLALSHLLTKEVQANGLHMRRA